jgi:sigma-B regulation protein RsbU (phosphoserine phosphatase)
VRGDGAALVVRVQNGGAPIAAARLARVFEPFERGEGRGAPRSLGLGLYIVPEIVRAHGGEITVRSEAQAGSVFVASLPRRRG